jgi:hypothetical protein
MHECRLRVDPTQFASVAPFLAWSATMEAQEVLNGLPVGGNAVFIRIHTPFYYFFLFVHSQLFPNGKMGIT